jgi:uncharacterized protein
MQPDTKTIPSLEAIRARRDEILRLAEEHGVANIRVVGSVARNEATADSDVDFLMTIPPKRTVFDLVGLWLDMQELLGYSVSIIPDSSEDPTFMQSVLEDAVPL